MRGKRIPRLVDIHVGRRVGARRRSLGMNKETLAKRIGASEGQLSRYEAGEASVYPARLLAIASVLEVPATYFFEGLPAEVWPGSPNAVERRRSGPSAVELRLMVEAYRRVADRELRHQIVSLTQALAHAEPGNRELAARPR